MSHCFGYWVQSWSLIPEHHREDKSHRIAADSRFFRDRGRNKHDGLGRDSKEQSITVPVKGGASYGVATSVRLHRTQEDPLRAAAGRGDTN